MGLGSGKKYQNNESELLEMNGDGKESFAMNVEEEFNCNLCMNRGTSTFPTAISRSSETL